MRSRLAAAPMVNADDDASHDRQGGDQINRAGHAAELHRSERQRGECDNVTERNEDDTRDGEDENEAQPDQNVDRSGGDAVDAEDEADVGCHADPSVSPLPAGGRSTFCGGSKPKPQRHFCSAILEGRSRKPLRANCFKLKNSRTGDVRRCADYWRSPPIREVRVHNLLRLAAAAAIASVVALPAKAADITVGLITSMTGPGASIGIPYAKGAAAGVAYKDEVDGIKLKLDAA